MKSTRTEALELKKLGWSPERIAKALEVDVERINDLLYGKPKQAKRRAQGVSPASMEQRRKVKGRACIVCRRGGNCHPAHLVDRSLGGDDDPRAVVPLCPDDHRAYDEGDLDLLPYLEPHFREEVAYAVELVGLMKALRRITNDRWVAVTTGGPE
jgi:hypothetical protein